MLDNTRRALRWAFRRVGRALKPPKLPDQNWLEKAAAYAPYTPDLPKIEQKKRALVFTYGTMKQGHGNHFLFERRGCEYRGECFTTGSFHLFRWDNGHDEVEAIALKEQERPRIGRLREPLLSSQPRSIKGEVYLVDPSDLIVLDTVMENGYVYHRERVKLILPYDICHGSYHTSERQYEHIWAYWYVGVPDWYKALEGDPESFKHIRVYEPNDPVLRSYYSFTMLDYAD